MVAVQAEKEKAKVKAGEEYASTADNQVTLPGTALRTTQGDAEGTDLYGSHKPEVRSAPRPVADV